MTIDKLTTALTQAAEAHHAYEATLGHPDANWQHWYASWIVDHYGPLREADAVGEAASDFSRRFEGRSTSEELWNA